MYLARPARPCVRVCWCSCIWIVKCALCQHLHIFIRTQATWGQNKSLLTLAFARLPQPMHIKNFWKGKKWIKMLLESLVVVIWIKYSLFRVCALLLSSFMRSISKPNVLHATEQIRERALTRCRCPLSGIGIDSESRHSIVPHSRINYKFMVSRSCIVLHLELSECVSEVLERIGNAVVLAPCNIGA